MGKSKDIAKQMATEAKLKNMLLKLPDDHAGMSQRELADKSGIPRRTIRKIEAEAIAKITDYIQQFIKDEGTD